ncbi:MAG: SAF domain-containing protein [Pseudonocardiales bacterium]|nr:SAF domain-containing protein [Pseudonocardiales bacterium]
MVVGVVGALLAVYAYRAAVAREGVVALVRDLPVGSVVQVGDVREVLLPPGSGLATVPWRDVDGVVGLVVSDGLRAGQVLTPGSVTTEQVPAPGQAVVGLSVEAGRLPATGLRPGDEVLVVLGAGAPPRRAAVVAAGDADLNARRTVDVLVAQADAEELALASAEGRVVIVLIGRG